jgi:hypothetical protein
MSVPMSVTVIPLVDYPDSTEEYSRLAYHLYTTVLKDYLSDHADAESVTFYVTKEREGMDDLLTGMPDDEETAAGLVVVTKNLDTDSIFFVSALLKADMLIRKMENSLPDTEMVAVWHRSAGLVAVGRKTNEDTFVEFPQKMVAHILPMFMIRSEDWEGRGIN